VVNSYHALSTPTPSYRSSHRRAWAITGWLPLTILLRESIMTDHRFSIGQQVLLERHERTKAEVVEVVRQMPSDEEGEPQYRVKASHESFERTAKEHQLSATIPPSS
jgi:hypothetical protein